jgi:4-carboxymuconolactone decarboxylase
VSRAALEPDPFAPAVASTAWRGGFRMAASRLPVKMRRQTRQRTTPKDNAMDQKRYEIGLAKRRQVLGEAYVDRALAGANDFNRDFQRLLTEYCWGETWGDETLKPRERSILNLGMIAALGKMEEFATHVRGALNNGLTPNEIRAALTQVTIYCGAPIGVDCFRVARPIIAEYETNRK